jgi:hypothetical protein
MGILSSLILSWSTGEPLSATQVGQQAGLGLGVGLIWAAQPIAGGIAGGFVGEVLARYLQNGTVTTDDIVASLLPGAVGGLGQLALYALIGGTPTGTVALLGGMAIALLAPTIVSSLGDLGRWFLGLWEDPVGAAALSCEAQL